MLFANISRFIAIMDEGQDQPTEATQSFDVFKENYAQSIAISHELKIDDVFVLANSLATERIKNTAMWHRFAQVAVEREFEVEDKDYFKSFANLAWSMSKVSYDGQAFWNFIERLFSTELEKIKEN